MARILTFELGPMQNFVYFIVDEPTKSCAIMDPGWEPETIIAELEKHKLTPQCILLTHTHYDHCQAVSALLKQYPFLKVFVHKNEWFRLSNIQKSLVQNEKPIELGKTIIHPLFTPGHQPSETCYLVNNNLFTGDCLFVDAIGRVDFAESNPSDMYNSLFQVISKLPDSTLILSGHNYGKIPTDTLGNQKKTNPYLQCKSKDEFMRVRGVL